MNKIRKYIPKIVILDTAIYIWIFVMLHLILQCFGLKFREWVYWIREMVVEKEKVSIPKLMKKTGLSRGFFYKNPIVRSEIDRALEQQAGMIDPRRTIIDQAMEREMELLQQQVRKLKYENENLKKENEKLKKALARKELNLIKQL